MQWNTSHKKGNTAFVTTQMIPKGIMLSEISQKNKHYTILLTHGI